MLDLLSALEVCEFSSRIYIPLSILFCAGDVAISSASFILVQSDLYTILTLVDLSRKVFRRVKFNFVCFDLYDRACTGTKPNIIEVLGLRL